MINLLKADFYKLKRSKALIICFAAMCLLLVLSVVIIKQNNDIQQAQGLGGALPLTAREFAFAAPSSADLTILLAILTALIFVTEFTHGTIKNTLTAGVPRWQLFLSKLIVLTVISSVYILAGMAVSLITGLAFFPYGAAFTFKEFMLLIGLWLLSTLFFAAYSAVYMFVGVLTRSIGGTIGLCLIIFSIFASTFVTVIAMIPAYYPDIHLGWLPKITDYFLSSMVASTISGDNYASADLWRMICMPFAYIIIFGGGGIFALYKKDI